MVAVAVGVVGGVGVGVAGGVVVAVVVAVAGMDALMMSKQEDQWSPLPTGGRVREIHDLDLAALVGGGPPRSPGLHLSQIIGDIMRTLEPERFGRDDLPEELMLVGLAFEDLLGRELGARYWGARPGEFRRDGIILTPDHLGDHGMEEFKATWLKGMDGIEAIQNPKLVRYLIQHKGYVHALGMDRGIIRILFINGNYTTRRWPELRSFELRYTPRELQENWAMLIQHARDRGWL